MVYKINTLMKKTLFILFVLPLLCFAQRPTTAKIAADSFKLYTYDTSGCELILENDTKDSTGGLLVNVQRGRTQFKKLRLIKTSDTTYVIKIGTSVIGDTIKTASAGGLGTVTSVSVTTANGVSGSVATATTTPAITLTLGNITPTSVSASGSVTGSNLSGTNTGDQDLSSYATSSAVATTYATKTNLADTSSLLRTLISAKGVGTVTSVATDATMTGGTITNSGTLKVDTTIISTKGNVTGLLLNKQDNLVSGTNIKTVNSNSLLGSGNVSVGTVTSVATGVGLSGGTITGSGTILADTTSVLVTKTFLTSSLSGVGSGASLSGLTAATATNTINNANFGQEWQWNTLTSGTGLKLSSTSTAAASNTQTLFSVALSGANAASTQTTYGAIFSNTKTGTSSTNIAGRFVASGATNNYAIEAESQARIISSSTGTRYLSLWSSSNECARIGNLNAFGAGANDNLDITNNCGMGIVFRTGSSGNGTERGRFRASGAFCLGTTGSDIAALEITGGSFANAITVTDSKSILLNGGTFKTSTSTNFGSDGSDNMFFQVAGGVKQILANANGVSVGANTTPAASAILDVVSSTKGMLIPRMTTVNRDAISSPATGLMIYDTTVNKVSVYNGTVWKYLQYE